MKKLKVPGIRFKGFTDDWQRRKLGDYMKIPHKESIEVTSIDQLMTIKLNLGGIVKGSLRQTLSLGSTKYYKRKAGQFIYGKQNFFNGSMAIIPNEFDGLATSGDVPSLDISNIDKDFLYRYVSRKTYWKNKEAFASGTGSKRIHEKTLLNFKISTPSIKEQEKIGDFFKNLDNLIELHQRELELTKDLKKSMLQKMFPKKGETTPEIRFDGFTDDWQERKLGEVVSLLKDGTHGTHKDVDEGVFLLSAKNIKNGKVLFDETDRKISKDEYKSIHKNFNLEKSDVLLTIVGSIGETAIIENPIGITFQRSVAYLRANSKITSQFLFTTISTINFQRQLKNRQVVSAQPGIYLGELSLVPLQIPSIEEQEKIGDFFKNLDNLIELHGRELDTLKQAKKSLLQHMFI